MESTAQGGEARGAFLPDAARAPLTRAPPGSQGPPGPALAKAGTCPGQGSGKPEALGTSQGRDVRCSVASSWEQSAPPGSTPARAQVPGVSSWTQVLAT
jgi:hypothetical protein